MPYLLAIILLLLHEYCKQIFHYEYLKTEQLIQMFLAMCRAHAFLIVSVMKLFMQH